MKSKQQKLTELKEKQISLVEDIRRLEEQIKTENNPENKLIKIKLSTGTIEVEKNLHTDMKSFKDIEIPQGFRLLTLGEFIELINEHYTTFWGNDGFDEWIAQPLIINKAKYPFKNIWGSAVDVGDDRLRFDGDSWSDDSGFHAFGVRFVKVKK